MTDDWAGFRNRLVIRPDEERGNTLPDDWKEFRVGRFLGLVAMTVIWAVVGLVVVAVGSALLLALAIHPRQTTMDWAVAGLVVSVVGLLVVAGLVRMYVLDLEERANKNPKRITVPKKPEA